MIKSIATVSSLLIALLTAPVANACSCAKRSIEVRYQEADVVYYAQVSMARTRLVAKSGKDDIRIVYEMKLRPVRIFKGRNPGTYTKKYERPYSMKLVVPVNPGKGPEMHEIELTNIVSSCDTPYRAGDIFLIFRKKGKPLGDPGECSDDMIARPTKELTEALERLVP